MGNSEHYELRNEIGLDADGVFIPDKQTGELSPSKVYTKVFGTDGYMEIDENKEERTQQKYNSRKSKPASSLEPIEEKKIRLEVKKEDEEPKKDDQVINRNGFNLVTSSSAPLTHKLKPNSFHKELISEYNEEVEKYRSSRLTLAVIESYQKPFSCEVCFVRFPSRAALVQHYSQSGVNNSFVLFNY